MIKKRVRKKPSHMRAGDKFYLCETGGDEYTLVLGASYYGLLDNHITPVPGSVFIERDVLTIGDLEPGVKFKNTADRYHYRKLSPDSRMLGAHKVSVPDGWCLVSLEDDKPYPHQNHTVSYLPSTREVELPDDKGAQTL